MKLNVLERVMLGSILPPETNFSQYKIITGLKKQLSFDEREMLKFGITQSAPNEKGEGQVNWTKDGNKDFTFGLTALEIIRAVLKKLDEEKKITANIGTLYEKFMGE